MFSLKYRVQLVLEKHLIFRNYDVVLSFEEKK